MNRTQKTLTIALWSLLVLAMISMVASGMLGRRDRENPATQPVSGTTLTTAGGPLFAAPAFELLDQDSKAVTADAFKGHVSIVDFIFTQCGGPCPKMTGKLIDLSKALPGDVFRFVSFSVDPERDTPQVLKEYAKRFNAENEGRLMLLTGTSAQMGKATYGFKVSAVPDPIAGVIHSTQFLLVDADGQVRGIYGTSDEHTITRLIDDARALAAKGGR